MAASQAEAQAGAGPGRVAVVTGAASGMGLGIARRFAARGDRVALLDLQAEPAEQAAEKLRADGLQALAVGVDVADRASVDRAFERVRDELGPVQILVTSAGIEQFEDFTDITPDAWERILAVNLTGTFYCIQACVKDMIEAGWGRIVTIASMAGQAGAPRMAHYSASKGGVLALTKSLALDLAPSGITVNTIPPALVDTPMARKAEATGDFPDLDGVAAHIPLRRAGTPEDIAAACAFLCSDDASYITGQEIAPNGGMRL